MTEAIATLRAVPKPVKGSGKAARKKRRRDLKRHREYVNWWVLEADGYQCQIKAEGACEGHATHAHHVFGRGRSPDDDCEQPDARLSVCHSCHVAIHRAPPNCERITQQRVEQCLEEALLHRPEFTGDGLDDT
jgi:hypothetical protein